MCFFLFWDPLGYDRFIFSFRPPTGSTQLLERWDFNLFLFALLHLFCLDKGEGGGGLPPPPPPPADAAVEQSNDTANYGRLSSFF